MKKRSASPPTPPATPAAIGAAFVLFDEALVLADCVADDVTTKVEVRSTVMADPSAFVEVAVETDAVVKTLAELVGWELVGEGEADGEVEDVDVGGGWVTLSPHDVENNVAVGELEVTVTVKGTGTLVVDVPPYNDIVNRQSSSNHCIGENSPAIVVSIVLVLHPETVELLTVAVEHIVERIVEVVGERVVTSCEKEVETSSVEKVLNWVAVGIDTQDMLTAAERLTSEPLIIR